MNMKKELKNRILYIKEKYPDVEICFKELKFKKGKTFIVFLNGGIDKDNAKEYMDNIVNEITKTKEYILLHNEFIEKYLDNPWTRILIFNFNNIDFNQLPLPKGRGLMNEQ